MFVIQSCSTLSDPMDCSPPGSSVHGIFQARILERVALSFSRGFSYPGIKPTLQADSLPSELPGKPLCLNFSSIIRYYLNVCFFYNNFQFSSVTQLCPTLCNPMDCSRPGLPAHHQLPEFTQTHVHWVGDAIHLSHLLSSPSPPAFSLFQHQGLFQQVSSSNQVAKVLEFQLQYYSFQWIFRTDFL